MEQLLIKLSETHYIVVDDSEIKEGDFIYSYMNKKIFIAVKNSHLYINSKKITHSTQPLESNNLYRRYEFINIKPLSLSEVEEAINGHNVQTMADEATNEVREENADYIFKDVYKEFYKDGFNAHKELVKDRLFTKKQMEMLFAYAHSVGMNTILQIQSPHLLPKQDSDKLRDELIQSFLPPTEWNIEFENGKLKLA